MYTQVLLHIHTYIHTYIYTYMMRNAPRYCQGRGIIASCAAPFFVSQSGNKTRRSLILVRWFLVRLLLFHLSCQSVGCVSISLFTTTARFARCRQHSPDSNDPCSQYSHELVMAVPNGPDKKSRFVTFFFRHDERLRTIRDIYFSVLTKEAEKRHVS